MRHGYWRWIYASFKTTFGGNFMRPNLRTDKDVQLWMETDQDLFRPMYMKHILQLWASKYLNWTDQMNLWNKFSTIFHEKMFNHLLQRKNESAFIDWACNSSLLIIPQSWIKWIESAVNVKTAEKGLRLKMAAFLLHLSLVALCGKFKTYHVGFITNETTRWQDKCKKIAVIFILYTYIFTAHSIYSIQLFIDNPFLLLFFCLHFVVQHFLSQIRGTKPQWIYWQIADSRWACTILYHQHQDSISPTNFNNGKKKAQRYFFVSTIFALNILIGCIFCIIAPTSVPVLRWELVLDMIHKIIVEQLAWMLYIFWC